jgi:TetR/AcrR family transcriptional regulator, transcriptional repressor for nem operon
MARPKAFVEEQALDAAINVFREHGFEGTSAEMLVRALKNAGSAITPRY